MGELLYKKISDKIMGMIITKELNPGDKAPSVREFALENNVNPKTVQKAFKELDDKNIFITSVGDGRFITDDSNTLKKVKDDFIREEVNKFLEKMKIFDYDKEDVINKIKEI